MKMDLPVADDVFSRRAHAPQGAGRLCYIANIRYPTEKAHGYQISKMCEAFTEEGWRVELWHPYRRQANQATAQATPREFYQVRREFSIRQLPNVDVVSPGLERWRVLSMAATALQDLGWAWMAARRAARTRFDLYYTREPSVAYFLTQRSLPTILEVHRLYRNFQVKLLRRLAESHFLAGVVSVTAALKEDLEKLGLPPGKITVEHDAVDWAHFSLTDSRAACQRRLGLPEDRWIVGYVGGVKTLGHDKGLRELICAVARVPEVAGRKLWLMCVGGTAAESADLRRFAASQGLSKERSLFHPRVAWKEVPLWLRACDVLSIPWPANEFSSRHTSPLKLFEYMAVGVPILATDLPSLREVLTDGHNAALAASAQPEHLAQGLRRLLENDRLRESLAARARQDAAQRTWTGRARRIAAAFAGRPK